jgi:hypothetical protein
MGIDASYSSGSAGMTAACLPPRGLEDNEKGLRIFMKKYQLTLLQQSFATHNHEDDPNWEALELDV